MADYGKSHGDLGRPTALRLSADIIAAYLRRNAVRPEELGTLIENVQATLSNLGADPPPSPPKQKPAVAISRSIADDYLICLEDGAKLKLLKRYLRSRFGMSPDDYRRKWNLPPEYPMVAPVHSRQRSDNAKHMGLGNNVRGH